MIAVDVNVIEYIVYRIYLVGFFFSLLSLEC